MDRKLHGMPAIELIARACYVTLHVYSLTSKNISVLHSCMCRGFHQHTPLWNSMIVKSVVFQGSHIWGQICVSQPVLPSLVHGTRLIVDYMNHTGPHFQDLLQSVTCGMQERLLYSSVLQVQKGYVHALLSAGVKQLGKEIIVILQFYTSCITTEQTMNCVIEVTFTR